MSSDTAVTDEHLAPLYQRRWTVEAFHTSLKQNVALERSPTRTETTQKNHIFAAMLAFLKVEPLKLHSHLNHFALKSQLYLKAVQACFKELKLLQQQSQHSAIQFIMTA